MNILDRKNLLANLEGRSPLVQKASISVKKLSFCLVLIVAVNLAPTATTSAAQTGGESSDDYGAPSRKRRRPPPSGNSSDVRVSLRGQRIPNYAEDGGYRSEDYDDDDTPNGTAAPQYDANGQAVYEDQDEIDGVFGHSRDEDHSTSNTGIGHVALLFTNIFSPLLALIQVNDPEDVPATNMVGSEHPHLMLRRKPLFILTALPHQMEKLLPSSQHR